MIGALVVTHGNLALELVEAARRILGKVEQLEAVPIGWELDVEAARGLILDAIERVAGPEGILILTDMFGGTPANISLSFLESGKVEIVTGVNLPMLIRFCKMRNEPRALEDVAQGVWAGGRDHIRVATSALKPGRTVRAGTPEPDENGGV